MIDENLLVAWNAAYWLMRSEARRQQHARFPDCDWAQVEEHDEAVSAVVSAQVELCMQAMQAPAVKPVGIL